MMHTNTLRGGTHDNGEWNRGHADCDPKRAADYRGLCDALREWISDHRLPPDDAYWWTRIALTEAAQLL